MSLPVMDSRDSASRPLFASLGLESFRSRLGLEDCGSRPQVYCLRLLILRRYGLRKFQRAFCLLYLQVRNNQSREEKCQKFEKKIQLEVVMTFFGEILEKYWHALQMFMSQCRSRNSSLESLDVFSLCLADQVSTTSLVTTRFRLNVCVGVHQNV